MDFFNTYAPVTHLTSVQMLVAITNAHGLELEQLDMKMAYLYGELNKTIYMDPPKGIDTNGLMSGYSRSLSMVSNRQEKHGTTTSTMYLPQ